MNTAQVSISNFKRFAKIPTIQLFASTFCNLKCPYCSQGNARKSKYQGDILNDPYILEHLGSLPDTHFYISGGEPLIHAGLIDFLKVAGKYNHIVSFDTNGVVSEEILKRILDSFPPEKWGFFNISHHLLAGVTLKRIERTCSILRKASIPHFVKYIGTPEIIPTIDQCMHILQNKGSGVAVTILQTFSEAWGGRHFPQDYTLKELLTLLNMVTLGTHGLQFFGGIQSRNHLCYAGSSYVAYNMKDKNEIRACCHRSDAIEWRETVFNNSPVAMRPCPTSLCLGDNMFIIGLQGLGDEMLRFEQVCLGNSPAIGVEAALEYIKCIADQVQLVNHERFLKIYATVMEHPQQISKHFSQTFIAPKYKKNQSSKYLVKSIGKSKLKNFYKLVRNLLQIKFCNIEDVAARASYNRYYYDDERWPGKDAWCNMAKYQANQDLKFPLKFNIEVTTQCIFKCEFCVLHSGRLAKRRSQPFMKYEDFVKIFLQIQPFATHIEFTGGEPLLNKDLYRMVALCNEAKIKTTIATNAKLLLAKNVKKLLDEPPSSLLIPYESGQVEAYEHHRIGGNFILLEQNIKAFIQERDRRGLSYPRIQLQTIVSRETVHNMDTFWRDAKQLGVDEACSKPIFIWPDGDAQYWDLMRKKYLIPNHPLSYYQTDSQGHLKKTGRVGYCPNIQNVHIGTDGSVIPCWYNLLSSPSIGNTLQTNFLDIWFSEKYEEFRTAMRDHTAYAHKCDYCIGIYRPQLFKKQIYSKNSII